MRCKTVEKNLSRWVDGELGARAAQQIGEHLAACAACERLALALQKIKGLVQERSSLPILSPSSEEAFWKKIAERDALKETSRFSSGENTIWESLFPASFSFAQLALIFLLVVLVGGGSGFFSKVDRQEIARGSRFSTPSDRIILASSGFPGYQGLSTVSLAASYLELR